MVKSRIPLKAVKAHSTHQAPIRTRCLLLTAQPGIPDSFFQSPGFKWGHRILINTSSDTRSRCLLHHMERHGKFAPCSCITSSHPAVIGSLWLSTSTRGLSHRGTVTHGDTADTTGSSSPQLSGAPSSPASLPLPKCHHTQWHTPAFPALPLLFCQPGHFFPCSLWPFQTLPIFLT